MHRGATARWQKGEEAERGAKEGISATVRWHPVLRPVRRRDVAACTYAWLARARQSAIGTAASVRPPRVLQGTSRPGMLAPSAPSGVVCRWSVSPPPTPRVTPSPTTSPSSSLAHASAPASLHAGRGSKAWKSAAIVSTTLAVVLLFWLGSYFKQSFVRASYSRGWFTSDREFEQCYKVQIKLQNSLETHDVCGHFRPFDLSTCATNGVVAYSLDKPYLGIYFPVVVMNSRGALFPFEPDQFSDHELATIAAMHSSTNLNYGAFSFSQEYKSAMKSFFTQSGIPARNRWQ